MEGQRDGSSNQQECAGGKQENLGSFLHSFQCTVFTTQDTKAMSGQPWPGVPAELPSGERMWLAGLGLRRVGAGSRKHNMGYGMGWNIEVLQSCFGGTMNFRIERSMSLPQEYRQ
jgi:hypothetical protein